MEHILIADSALVVDWHNATVSMGCGFIKMHHKVDDVLLTKLSCYKVVDVLCPFLDLRHTQDMVIATFSFKIYLLIAKGEFCHSVMRTTEHELHRCTDIRITAPDIRVSDATFGKEFCHTYIERSGLINRNNLATLHNLKIEVFTATVIVPFLYRHFIALIRPSSKNLIADVTDTSTGLYVYDLSVYTIISHSNSF